MIAGLKDVITRHASSLSIFQTVALLATGIIWSRYSLVIIPKNWGLFSVNAFVALTQLIQLGRAIHYYYYRDSEIALATNETMVDFTTLIPDESLLLTTLSSIVSNVTDVIQ